MGTFVWIFGDKEKRIVAFAIFYSLGNFLNLFSTGFLKGNIIFLYLIILFKGFKNQCESIFAKSRRIASIIYFSSILLTLICAFALPPKPRKPLVFFCLIFQYLAFIWYALSYIPFGRKILKKIAKYCCCSDSS